MKFKITFLHGHHFLMLRIPFAFKLTFQVSTDLKIICAVLENSFDQGVVNVFEMDSGQSAFISFNLV